MKGARDRVMRGALKPVVFVVVTVVLTGVYFAVNYAGLYLKFHFNGLSPFWPAAGMGVALLWLFGLRWWPVIVIGELLGAVYGGRDWVVGCTDSVSQMAEALLASVLLKGFDVRPELARTRDVLGFLALGVLLPASVG